MRSLGRQGARGGSVGVVGVALAVALAGCGGHAKATTATSAPTTSAPATSAPATTSSTASGAGAAAPAAITQNWTTFFDAKTPVATRISLLQDGQQFASVIRAQSGSGLAASATAKVTGVTTESPTQAKVTYSILIAGAPALTGQSGVAVLQDGIWKVGDSSFCGLLALENGGKAAGLPAACPATA
jgi:hypothetical protein